MHLKRNLTLFGLLLGSGVAWHGCGSAQELPGADTPNMPERALVSLPEGLPELARPPEVLDEKLALVDDPDERLASEWTPVSEGKLDDLRGGFDIGTGLLVSFGIERAVSVNGSVVSNTSFNIPDVANLTPEQAKLASVALSEVTLVQIGPGNSVQPGVSAALGPGLIIQNTLNDQVIRSQTVINTSVNSLALLKSVNVEGVLRDALANAVSVK